MILVCTFASRKHDPDVIELVDAWDEFSVEGNYDGFEKSRQAALDSWGDDLLHWVTVDVDVEMQKIYDVLVSQVTVKGTPTVVNESSRG